MDTLGTITPVASDTAVETDQRTEALERLRYLAEIRTNGILQGDSGVGKSKLMSQLARSLRRDGYSIAEIDLWGVEGRELPLLLCSRLGGGLDSDASPVAVWSWLQDYAEAGRRIPRRLVFLLDHLDRAADSIVPTLGRAMSMFGDGCSWLGAARPELSPQLRTFFRERSWLRVELGRLNYVEATRVLAQELSRSQVGLHLTPAAMDAAWEESQGHLRRLRQLAELFSLVAQAEGTSEITDDMVREVALELA